MSQKYLTFCSKFMFYLARSVKAILPIRGFPNMYVIYYKYAIREIFNLLETKHEEG
jgi:hypothetical protein